MPPANDNGQIISAMHSPIVYELTCVLDAEEAAVPGGSAMELKNGKAEDGPFTLARRLQVCNLTIWFRQNEVCVANEWSGAPVGLLSANR